MYLEELKASNIPVLGMLVWYNVESDAEMKLGYFKAKIRSTQAPVAGFKPPKPANVFRRATEEVSNLKKQEAPDGVLWSFKMQDLGYDPNFVTRQLSATAGKDVGSIKLGKAVFDKTKGTVEWTEPSAILYINGWMDKMVTEIKSHISDFMHKNAEIIHSLPIRESIRKAIEGPLNGLLVKPGGGLYFVPLSEYNGLLALIEMFGDSDNRIHIGYAPLVNDSKQKSMLADQLYKYLVTESSTLNTIIGELRDGDKTPTAKKLKEVEEALIVLQTKKDSYKVITGSRIHCREIMWARENLERLWIGETNG